MNNANAIPCMVLTFTEKELALVKITLEAEGYGENLKQWILDTMADGDDEEPSKYEGAADRVINNVSEFVRDNPTTIQAVGTLAGSLLNRVIKKGPPK